MGETTLCDVFVGVYQLKSLNTCDAPDLRSRGPRQQGVKMKKIKNNNLLKKNSDQKLRFQSHSIERLKLDSDWTQIGLRLDSNWTQIGLKLYSNMVFELFLSFF